jgi:Arm DNA-binding domain
MRAIIGEKLLSSHVAQPATKPFEIYDTRLPGFTLPVQPSGVRSYYARLGSNHRIALGKVGELLADEARQKCPKVLGNVAHGRHPLYGLDGPEGPALGQFIHETFTPWVEANRPRTAADTLEKLHRQFHSWFPNPCALLP